LRDPRISNLTRLVVDYCVSVRDCSEVSIFRNRGAIPFIRESVKTESLIEAFYRYTPESVLKHVSPIEKRNELARQRINQDTLPTHTKPLANIDPEKLRIRSSATRGLSEIFLKRSA